MNTKFSKWWILGGVLLVLAFYFISVYNGLIGRNAAVDNQWAQVETQYQRRLDLIPNLVSSTQGVLTQEQKVFGDLAKARAAYSGAQSTDQKAQAAGQVESALSRLLVIVENYPQLRSNETVQSLMDELSGTENRISVERRRYNDEVTRYNVYIMRFPTNIPASLFGYHQRTLFQSIAGADQAPKVELNK
jgi:LemA protein